MTVARRRSAQLLLSLLATLVVALGLTLATATSASATEGEATTAEEPTGFGSGQWDGMMLAAGAGLVFAIVTFGMSNPGDIERVDSHH